MSSRARAGAVAAPHASWEVPPARFGFRSLAYLFAAAALGGTFWPSPSGRTPESFRQAWICLGCLLLGISLPSQKTLERWLAPLLTPLLAAAFMYFFANLLRSRDSEAPFVHLVSAAAVLIGLGLVRDRRIERWRIPLLLAAHAVLGVWQIRTSPSPHIDVWVWHNEAIKALFAGQNPYAITMPNIYEDARFYDPSMVVNGRVLTGYQYPPLSLLFAIPGYLLGDYRYSMLGAMTLGGACMAYARPGGLSATAMALWLFSPGCLFILDQGYTEPMLVMLLALTVFCAMRRSRWLFVPLGLLLAGKQYMAIMVAPLLWLLPVEAGGHAAKARWRLIWQSVAVAAAVTLPFFVINPKAFFDCMVLLQFRQPFRAESLSVLGWWADRYGERLSNLWGFGSLPVTSALALWRSERSAASFAAGLALVSFVFFFLSKQAFSNYYFFALGAICCSIAVASEQKSRASDAR